MSDEIQVIDHRNRGLVESPALEGDGLVQAIAKAASNPSVDITKMQALFAMHKELQAMQAQAAFNAAVAAFKLECPMVKKDKTNNQYNSKYASIGALVNTITPILSKYGLSISWKLDQSHGISVSCTLKHSLGHFETASMSGPADTSGAKNPLQQIKSTRTYLHVCTFEDVLGLATEEGSRDDDGSAAGEPTITESQAADLKGLIQEVQAKETQFLAYFKIGSLEELPAKKMAQACAMLRDKGRRATK